MNEKEKGYSFEDSQSTILRKANTNLRKKKSEIEKIMELQEIIDKAKNLIFTAQDIDCTIDYPYCPEIENDDRNTESMGSELSTIRSYLEWMDNKCWSYQRLKK